MEESPVLAPRLIGGKPGVFGSFGAPDDWGDPIDWGILDQSLGSRYLLMEILRCVMAHMP